MQDKRKKKQGCSILFINDEEKILLLLRDDKPEIPYPNMWDFPGGGLEGDETPNAGIEREIKEEFGITLKSYHLFTTIDFPDRIETVFWKKENLDIETIDLKEGQKLKWFSKKEVENTLLAFDFSRVALDFFNRQEGI